MCDYGRLSWNEALALPCDVFALLRKKGYIHVLSQTEEGRQHLSDCERLSKTEPDFGAIRSMKGYERTKV